MNTNLYSWTQSKAKEHHGIKGLEVQRPSTNKWPGLHLWPIWISI